MLKILKKMSIRQIIQNTMEWSEMVVDHVDDDEDEFIMEVDKQPASAQLGTNIHTMYKAYGSIAQVASDFYNCCPMSIVNMHVCCREAVYFT